MANTKAPQDPGFGSLVSTGKGERLLNRDGTFAVRRHGLPLRAVISLYHSLLVMRWDAFLGLLAILYVAGNALFGLAYIALGDGALTGPETISFSRAFFFSVQTATTIGYGHIVPVSTAANILVTIEAFVGMLGVALVTGIVFARFSKPKADMIFSDRAVIAPYRGITGLQFRLANQRRNQILEPQVRVFISMLILNVKEARRDFVELKLERDQLAFFPLSWTVVHPIDEDSPLYGLTARDMEERRGEVVVTLNGIDETFSQMVHARSSYTAEEITWNARFKDIYERTPSGTIRSINLAGIHDIEEPAQP